MRTADELTGQIASASREQHHGLDVLEKAVDELRATVRENGDCVGRVARGSETARQSAEHLATLMDFFHVEEATPPTAAEGTEGGSEESDAADPLDDMDFFIR